MIELDYKNIDENVDIHNILHGGECIIIRNSPEIKKFRDEIVNSLKNNKQKNELMDFYNNKIIPSEKTVTTLFKSLKYARKVYYLGTLLYDFIKRCHFENDIYIDGGISRFVVPVKDYEKFYQSNLFEVNDFSRKFSGDSVEMFMNGVSNIHRDYNRSHISEMYNFWIPMHDLNSSEVLQIFEKDFFKDIKDLDNNEDNYSLLSTPEKYHLNFGDFVIFHSEQLHVSPRRCEDTTRRHSFDFRIVTKCDDDNGHYRSNFKEIENFHFNNANKKNYDLFSELALKNCNSRQAYDLYKRDEVDLDELFEIYKELPYTEDKYVELAKELIVNNPKEAEKIVDFACDKTIKYFWIYKFSKLYEYLGNKEKSNILYKKALVSAKKVKRVKADYPINYSIGSKELFLNDLVEKEKSHKNLLIVPKGYFYNIEKITDSLKDIEMIVPLELESHLTYMKATSIQAIYGDIFTTEKIDINRFKEKLYDNIYYLVSAIDVENRDIFYFISLLKSKKFISVYENGSVKDITTIIQNRVSLINTSYISPLAVVNSSVIIGTENYIADKVTIDDYVTIKDRVNIGRCTGISTHVHIYNDCSIGNFSAIGANSVIAGPPHHIDIITISNKMSFSNLKHQSNYTYIGSDVWIGANVTVKANIKIGNGAVIGANSFVNKDIPPYAIAFGVPAKVYSYRFDNKIIEKLKKSKWWDIVDIEEIILDVSIEKSLKLISKRKRRFEKNTINISQR